MIHSGLHLKFYLAAGHIRKVFCNLDDERIIRLMYFVFVYHVHFNFSSQKMKAHPY